MAFVENRRFLVLSPSSVVVVIAESVRLPAVHWQYPFGRPQIET